MRKASILIVDDDEVLAGIVRRILVSQGYEVRLAASVAEARTLTREEPAQIALLDLCLPDGDGASLGQELSERNPELQMILMTAYPLRLMELPESLRGFARILTKPLDLGELRGAVAEILYSRELKRRPGEQALMVRPVGPIRWPAEQSWK